MTTYTSAQPAYRAPTALTTDTTALVQGFSNGKPVTPTVAFTDIHAARDFLRGRGARIRNHAQRGIDEAWTDRAVTWTVLR